MLAVVIGLTASRSEAQEARAEQARQERSRKAEQLHPYERTPVEAVLYTLEDKLRYFHGFEENQITADDQGEAIGSQILSDLTFWRANIGLAFRW